MLPLVLVHLKTPSIWILVYFRGNICNALTIECHLTEPTEPKMLERVKQNDPWLLDDFCAQT